MDKPEERRADRPSDSDDDEEKADKMPITVARYEQFASLDDVARDVLNHYRRLCNELLRSPTEIEVPDDLPKVEPSLRQIKAALVDHLQLGRDNALVRSSWWPAGYRSQPTGRHSSLRLLWDEPSVTQQQPKGSKSGRVVVLIPNYRPAVPGEENGRRPQRIVRDDEEEEEEEEQEPPSLPKVGKGDRVRVKHLESGATRDFGSVTEASFGRRVGKTIFPVTTPYFIRKHAAEKTVHKGCRWYIYK